MSEKIAGPHVELTGDPRKLIEALKAGELTLEQFVSKIEKSLKGAQTTAERSFGAITGQIAKMANELKGGSATHQLNMLEQALVKVGGVSKLSSEQLTRVTAQLDALRAAGGKLPPELSKIANSFSNTFKSIQGSLTGAGMALTVGLTAPLTALAAVSLKSAVSFESAFAGVRKTVNATEPELQKLSAGFREMSKNIPVSADALASLGMSAGQLGIKTQNILGFVDVMAKLGTATNLSSEEAASSLARLANITQMSQLDFDRLGSTIVHLGNNFATTEKEIVEMGLRIAGAGHAVGMTEHEILGLATALSSVGVHAEAGGSAISRVMLDMADQVRAGGRELQTLAAVSSMTAEQFRKAFQDNAAGAITKFISGLAEIQKSGGDTVGVLQSLGFSEIRVRDAMLRLAGAGELTGKALSFAAAGWRENSALTKEAAARFETTESQLTLLWNRLQDVARTVGTAFLPAIRSAADMVSSLIPYLEAAAQWFASLPTGIQLTVVGFLGLIAAVGPLLIIIGQLAFAIQSISAVVAALKTVELASTFASWGMSAGTFTGTLGALSLALKACAVAAVALGSYALTTWFVQNTEAGQKLVQTLGDIAARMSGVDVEGLQRLDLEPELQKIRDRKARPNEPLRLQDQSGFSLGVKKPASKVNVETEEQEKARKAAEKARKKELADYAKSQLEFEKRNMPLPRFPTEDEDSAAGVLHIQRERSTMMSHTMFGGLGTAHFNATEGKRAEALREMDRKKLRDVVVETDKGVKKQKSWNELLSASADFAELMGMNLESGIGKSFGGVSAMLGAGAGFKTALGGQDSGKKDNSGLAIMTERDNLALAMSGLGALTGIISSAKGQSNAGGALAGGMQGAAFGANFGPIGAGIGAVMGSVTGLITASLTRHATAFEHVGRQWGVEISKGLGEKLDEDAKKKFNGNIEAAALANLPAIFNEAGGVEKFGVDNAIGKVRDIFSVLERGEMTVQQAGEAFNSAFGEIAPHAIDKTTGLLKANAAELIKLSKEAGVASQAVLDFQSEQATAASAGLTTFMQNAAISSQSSATAIAGSIGLIYNQLIAGGASPMEALKAVTPAIQELRKELEETGFSGGAAFAMLDSQIAILENKVTGPMVEGVNALGASMAALNNAGLMNNETFTALSAQVTATTAALAEQGVSGPAALALMQPTLQMIWQLWKDQGYAIDENTQKMLEEAEAAGLVGEKHRSAQEQAQRAMERTVELLQAIAVALGAIPEEKTATVNVQTHYTETGKPGESSPDIPEFATGSGGLLDFGTETIAALHGREMILTASQLESFTANVFAAGSASSAGRPADARQDQTAMLVAAGLERLASEISRSNKNVVTAIRDQSIKR